MPHHKAAAKKRRYKEATQLPRPYLAGARRVSVHLRVITTSVAQAKTVPRKELQRGVQPRHSPT